MTGGGFPLPKTLLSPQSQRGHRDIFHLFFVFSVSLWLALILIIGFQASASDEDLRPKKDGIYRGTKSCTICHDFREFETAHNQSVRGPQHILQTTVQGQKASIFDPRTPGYEKFIAPYKAYFNSENVLYTMGGHGWLQRFLTRLVPSRGDATDSGQVSILSNNDLVVMGIQWNQREGRWEDFHGPTGNNTWASNDFNKNCIGCHTTGFDPTDTTKLVRWVDDGIGCEACHGPSNEINPIEQLDARQANEVCGSCHTRGVSKSGHYEFPWNPQLTRTFQPKQKLDLFLDQSPAASEHFWPDGESKSHHQQWPDFRISRHSAAGVLCTDCHHPHRNDFKGQLRDTPLATCLACHSSTLLNSGDRYQHSRHTDKQATCIDCHMPKTAEAADPGDIRSHTFLMIEPQKSYEFGIPSGCVGCHTNGPGKPKTQVELEGFFREIAPRYREVSLVPATADSTRWTGFALANVGARAARLFFTLFDPDGMIFKGGGVKNPRILTLEPGKQTAYVVDDFFSGKPAGNGGWVRLSHFEPNVKGFYLEGDVEQTELTGLTVARAGSRTWITPILWPEGDNKVALTNLSAQDATVTLTPMTNSGALAGESVASRIPSRGRKDFYFSATFPNLVQGGYVMVQSDVELAGQVTALQGKTLASARLFPSSGGANAFTIPHAVVGDGWDTRLVFYNPSDRTVEVLLEMRRDGSGSIPYGGIQRRSIGPRAMLNEAVSSIVPSAGARIEGYMRARTSSSSDHLHGLVAFSSRNGSAVAALSMESTGRKEMTFSHVAQGNGYWTGLALLAPGGGSALLELYDADGILMTSRTASLNDRRAATLDQWLSVTRASGGYVKVRSDSEIFAFEVFGNDRLSIIAAIPPQ